jgi:hypothetical protein
MTLPDRGPAMAPSNLFDQGTSEGRDAPASETMSP